MISLDPNAPAWDQLCAYLHALQMAVEGHPRAERAVWEQRMRCRRMYEMARDPEAMAKRLLQIVTKPQQQMAA
jgi:hypothetical protein